MALWDRLDLHARFKRMGALPANSEAPNPDADVATMIDALLTEAQSHWFGVIAIHAPWVLVGAPTLLTSSDGGLTYDFPTAPFPGGRIEIRASRDGDLLRPGNEWDNAADYVWEGDRIRIPNGKTRSFANGPYARYIAAPGVIDGDNAPTLEPAAARILIVYHALALWASRPGSFVDPNTYWELERRAAWGSGGEAGLIPTLKTQLYGHGLGSHADAPQVWWRSMS